MTDEVQDAQEATPEVVQSEAVEAEAAEAPESTEGQEQDPPAEVTDEEPEAEEKSPSKLRRERRKAHQAELRERAEKAEAELAKVQERLSQFEGSNTQPPKEADFADYNEYLMAAAAWQAGQQYDMRQKADIEREAQAKKAEYQQVQQQREAAVRENWAAQVAEAKTRYADFDQVVFADDVPVTEGMAKIMATSDHGADVAYYLGMNKAEAAQIARMPPIEQAMALGRLEATVKRPSPRTQSQAPSPVTPVKAKASAEKSWEDMTADEYAKWREAGGKP